MPRHYRIRKVRVDGLARYDVVARSETEPDVDDVITTFPGDDRGHTLAVQYVQEVTERNAALEREP